MTDPRNRKLAKILVEYSINAKPGDKVAVSCTSAAGLPLAREVYKLLLYRKTFPYMQLGDESMNYLFYKNATKEQLLKKPEVAHFVANWADKFINIVAEQNPKELANVNPERQALRSKITKPIKDILLTKKWVLTYYPTVGMAYACSMSLHELEEFYFKACLKDWSSEKNKMKKLKKILDDGQEVRIIGRETDLKLSFKGRKFAICAGEYNMPDGEVFGGPVETSAKGRVFFDLPSLYNGKEVKGIRLNFVRGKVSFYDAQNNKDFLKKMLNTDKGAKTLGEFGIGTNYSINKFMQNILFDEKAGGTIHLALGCSFKEEEGGGKNDSAIHWDLIKDMRLKDSKILIDGKLIFKDGKILV